MTEALTEPQIKLSTFISHRKEPGDTDQVMGREDMHRSQAKISSQRKENTCPRSPHMAWHGSQRTASPDLSPLAHFTLSPFYLKH